MPNNYDYEPPIEPPGTVDEANQRLADFVASYARATFERMGHHTHWSGLAARLVEERDALSDLAGTHWTLEWDTDLGSIMLVGRGRRVEASSAKDAVNYAHFIDEM